MKVSSRFLPRLNLCYLQKKAYQTHLQKMKNIKGSISNIKRSHSYSKQLQMEQLKTILPENMAIIKERADKLQARLSPYHKKIQQQTQRQNFRLFQAIEKCSPTLDRKNMSKHSLLSQEFRERICKFKVVPQLNKTALKCQISLDKLRKSKLGSKKGKSFSEQTSKQGMRLQRSSTVKQQFITNHEDHQPMNIKKDNTQNLLLSRNKNKIKTHFQRSQLSMRIKQKIQGFRQNLQSQSNKKGTSICKWKTRCFTTQAQSHQLQI